MVYQFIAAPAGICDEMPMAGWARSVMPLPPLSGTAEAIRDPPSMSVCCTGMCCPPPLQTQRTPKCVCTDGTSSAGVNQHCPSGRLYVLAVNRCFALYICVSVKPHSCNIGAENLNL